MASTKLEYVQALRAAAVLAVVYYHWMGGEPFLQYGYLGVDLFFVISGFIMAASTRGNDSSVGYSIRFLFRRLTRVWPAYAIISCAVAVSGLIPQSGMSAIERLIKSILFVPLWNHQPTIPPGWSLPFEMAFYFIFAASMLFGRLRWIALVTLMSIGLLVLPLAIVGHFSLIAGPPYPVDGAWVYLAMIGNPTMWSFLFGVGACLVSDKGYSISRFTCAAIVAGLIGLGFLIVPPDHTAVAGAIFAGAMLTFALTNNREPFDVPRGFVFIGDISYSLYLVHYPVKMSVNLLLFPFVTDARQLWLLFIVYVVASIGIAALSRRWLEEALTGSIRSYLSTPASSGRFERV